MPKDSYLGDDAKRVPFNLPMDEYQPLKDAADARHITVTDMIRKFIKIGLLVANQPDKLVFIRDGEEEKQILLL